MEQPRIINLPRIPDRRGNLSFAEQFSQVPFEIKRTYWIYDVPGDAQRGGHAFKHTSEFIISLSGAFDVVLSNGTEQHVFTLNRSYYGLLVPHGWWRVMNNFSTNSVALVLASTSYDPDDYLWDFDEYKTMNL